MTFQRYPSMADDYLDLVFKKRRTASICKALKPLDIAAYFVRKLSSVYLVFLISGDGDTLRALYSFFFRLASSPSPITTATSSRVLPLFLFPVFSKPNMVSSATFL
jgi:hypothetical protein